MILLNIEFLYYNHKSIILNITIIMKIISKYKNNFTLLNI